MEKVLAENVKRLCKEQKKQLKDLAAEMGVDPASLNRAMYGNADLIPLKRWLPLWVYLSKACSTR